MEEVWKDIPLFDGLYQASNLGNIRAKKRKVKKYSPYYQKVIEQTYKQRLLKPVADKSGYYRVHLGVNGKKYNGSVHRMVLMAFVGMPQQGQECCHNDGNPQNNRLENLRWDTHSENNRDRKRHGTYPTGKDHHNYGKPMPAELKAKLIAYHTGIKRSDKIRKKMSEAQTKRWANVQKQKTA